MVRRILPALLWHLSAPVGSWARGPPMGDASSPRSFLTDFQDGEEGLLRHFHAPHGFHALLSFLLLFKELAFPRNIAAITFRKDVLLHGSNRLTRDDLAPDCRLNGNLINLSWNEFLHFLGQLTSALNGTIFMSDKRQGIHRLTVQ